MFPIKFVKVTWDKENDLAHISFFDKEFYKEFFLCAKEIHIKNFGRLIVDIGINGEILGIESLWASKHFPKWVLDQAEM